jgi:hypothetical protein
VSIAIARNADVLHAMAAIADKLELDPEDANKERS